MSENEVLELWAKNDKAEHQNSTHINKMRIDFERKFAIAQAEIENLSKNSISDEKINDLEDELNIEKEKARTAMELARIEINGAEQRFKEILDEKGIKQIWLAEKIGKSYNMVNGYVQNRRQPSLELLNEIAKVLDVDVKELIQSSTNKDAK